MSGLDKNIRATEYFFDKVADVFDISVPDLTPLNKVIMDAATPKLGIFGIEKPDVVRVKISQKLLDTTNSKTNTTWFLGQFENNFPSHSSSGWNENLDAIFGWANTSKDDTGKPNHATDWSSDSATVWNLSIKSTQAFDMNNPGGEITYNIKNCGTNKSLDKNRNGYTGDDKYHLIKTNNKNLPPNTIEAYIKWKHPTSKMNYYLCVIDRRGSFTLTDTDLSLHVAGAHEVKWVPETDFSNSDYKNSTVNKWLFTVDPDYKRKQYIFNEIDRYMVNRLYKSKAYNFGDPKKNEYMVLDFDLTLNENIKGDDKPTLCSFGSVKESSSHQYILLVCSEDGIRNSIKLFSDCNRLSAGIQVGFPAPNAPARGYGINSGVSLELNKTYNVKVVIQCASNRDTNYQGFDKEAYNSPGREIFMYLDNKLVAKTKSFKFIMGGCAANYNILHKNSKQEIYFRFGGIRYNSNTYNIKNMTLTPKNIYMTNILRPYSDFKKNSEFYLYDRFMSHKQGTNPTSYHSANPPDNNNNINNYGIGLGITNNMINMEDETGNIGKINSANALDLKNKSNGLILRKGHPFFTTITSPDNFSKTDVKITGVINLNYKDLLADIPKILIKSNTKEVEKEINYDKTSGVWEVSFTLAKGIYDIQIKQKINNIEGVNVIEQEYLSKIGVQGQQVSTAKHKKWKNFFSNPRYQNAYAWLDKGGRGLTGHAGFDIAGAYDCRGRWNYDEDIFVGVWGPNVNHSSSAYNNEGEVDFGCKAWGGWIYGLCVPGNGSIYGTSLDNGVTSGFGEYHDKRFFIDYNSEIEELPFAACTRAKDGWYGSCEDWDYECRRAEGGPGGAQWGGGQTYNMVKYTDIYHYLNHQEFHMKTFQFQN